MPETSILVPACGSCWPAEGEVVRPYTYADPTGCTALFIGQDLATGYPTWVEGWWDATDDSFRPFA